MQGRCSNYTDVDVEMFVLLSMRPIGQCFRRAFEMNREAVTADAGIEGLIAKVQLESELSAVICGRRIEIIDQKLWCDSRQLCDTRDDRCRHTLRSSHKRPNVRAYARARAGPVPRPSPQEAQQHELLILFAEGLDVRFAVRIEEFLAAFAPRRFEFRPCNVPVEPAFPGDSAQVLPELFQSRPPEEPVTHIDLMNDETRLEDDRVGIMGLWRGSVYSAMSRSFWTDRPASERKGQ